MCNKYGLRFHEPTSFQIASITKVNFVHADILDDTAVTQITRSRNCTSHDASGLLSSLPVLRRDTPARFWSHQHSIVGCSVFFCAHYWFSEESNVQKRLENLRSMLKKGADSVNPCSGPRFAGRLYDLGRQMR